MVNGQHAMFDVVDLFNGRPTAGASLRGVLPGVALLALAALRPTPASTGARSTVAAPEAAPG